MLHCSATPEGRDVTGDDIRRMHTSPVSQGGRGWKQVGYSEFIRLNGDIEVLVADDGDQDVDPWEITNGARGYNAVTKHLCYAGGVAKTKPKGMRWFPPKDTRTAKQLKSMEVRVKELLQQHPKAKLIGHNQVANKACPSFDVRAWAESVGIAKSRVVQ